MDSSNGMSYYTDTALKLGDDLDLEVSSDMGPSTGMSNILNQIQQKN